MTDIPIYCAFDEMVAIEDLKPNPRNPNQHPKRQIKLLAKIIKEQGWRAPITVSTRSGLVVRGHGRYGAAKLLGLAEAPVDKQDYGSDVAEYADLIADNRIAELAELDEDLLKVNLEDLRIGPIDLELTGFSLKEIHDLFNEADNKKNKNDEYIPESFQVLIACETEVEQRDLLERFNREGLKCRALIS